ncbi:MAG TPA: hypothetical protein VGM37_18245 [Armatimonadota bacterium]|jgi:hypothetical protein
MPVEFRCPQCGQLLSAPDEAAGSTGSCRFCGATVTAPGAPGEPALLVGPGPAAASGPVPPDGTLDLGAILSESWQTLSANWGLFIASELIVIIAQSIANGPFNFNSERVRWELIAILVPIGIALMLALFPIQLGMLYISSDVLARGNSEIPRVFAGYKQYGKLLITLLLQTLAGVPIGLVIGFPIGIAAATKSPFAIGVAVVMGIAGIIGLFYVMLGLSLATMEVINRNADPMDALRASWSATQGRRLEMFAIQLVMSLVSTVGVFACCVGLVFTAPLASIAQVIVYRQLRGLQPPPAL